jgi:hypothetical protein
MIRKIFSSSHRLYKYDKMSLLVLQDFDYLSNSFFFICYRSDFQGHSFKAFGEDLEVSYDCRVDPSYIGYQFILNLTYH